jgi:hypothetical protein
MTTPHPLRLQLHEDEGKLSALDPIAYDFDCAEVPEKELYGMIFKSAAFPNPEDHRRALIAILRSRRDVYRALARGQLHPERPLESEKETISEWHVQLLENVLEHLDTGRPLPERRPWESFFPDGWYPQTAGA